VRKLIIDMDPGIGDAVAAVLALLDPQLDVLALTATPGCVTGSIASRNLHVLLAETDPPKWPRIGASRGPALLNELTPVEAETGLCAVHGPTGLGDFEAIVPELHHQHDSVSVLLDVVRAHPNEVTVLTLGPLGNLAAACERMPEFLGMLQGLVCLGGSIAAGGDATAAAEMNVYLNPEAARAVLNRDVAKMLIPLDATNKLVLTFDHFRKIAEGGSRAHSFLRRVLPFYFRAHHQFRGMEGVELRELVALAAVAQPGLFRLQSMPIDVETEGQLTRGATVCDRRRRTGQRARVQVATEFDVQGVIDYMTRLLASG
jgi:inosine-uridine nucleoside N-ribohydrolase